MQALATRPARLAVAKKNVARPVGLRVVCQAQKASKPVELAKKAAAIGAALPTLLATSPALALVDERMNGDGAGLILGVNNSILAWVLGGVFTTIWILYFTSQKDYGDFEDDDAGLGL